MVIVDQVEELITLSGPAERDAFLGLLAHALDADRRTADELLLLHRMALPGYGMRRSVSRIWWPTPTAASVGN